MRTSSDFIVLTNAANGMPMLVLREIVQMAVRHVPPGQLDQETEVQTSINVRLQVRETPQQILDLMRAPGPAGGGQ